MTFKPFHTDNDSSQQALPWLEDFVKSFPDSIGQTYDIKAIRLTPKGLLFMTDSARGFIYKSHQTYSHVVEFVKAWSGRKEKSAILQVLVTSTRPFGVLGVDEDRHGIWSTVQDESWTQAYATVADNPDIKPPVNPFPMPSPASHVLTDDMTLVGIPEQTSNEQPLAAPASSLNGAKRTKTPKAT